jgi:acetyl esterase
MSAYPSTVPDRAEAAALRRLLALPRGAMQVIAGTPVELDGQRLETEVQLMLRVMAADPRPAMETLPPDAARATIRHEAAAVAGRPLALARITETSVEGAAGPLRARLHVPREALEAPAPLLIYFHGGGWVVGDLDTHDGSCRLLARETGAVVMAVDYRLAPEHRFPAAVDDALAAFRWAAANPRELACRAGAVAVMGDSAGGTLAAVVCQQARDLGGPMPVAQGLVYPGTDLRMMTRSMDAYAHGFYLTREDIAWFQDQYLPDAQARLDPRASPLLAEDLAGLPPAHIWTAGFDPLRDEGRAYADRLAASGVLARYRCLDDQVHGFFGMGVLPDGVGMVASVCREMGGLIDDALAGPVAPPGGG